MWCFHASELSILVLRIDFQETARYIDVNNHTVNTDAKELRTAQNQIGNRGLLKDMCVSKTVSKENYYWYCCCCFFLSFILFSLFCQDQRILDKLAGKSSEQPDGQDQRILDKQARKISDRTYGQGFPNVRVVYFPQQ